MQKLIIFDCDGTLVDSEIIACKFFPKVWSSMGVEINEEFFLCNFVGTGSDADVVKKLTAQLPPIAMTVADAAFDTELARSLQPVSGMKDLLLWLNSLEQQSSNTYPLPYLPTNSSNLKAASSNTNLLSRLAPSFCVASNSSLSYIKKALNKTELASFFGTRIFSAHQVSRPKPAPDIFLQAAHTLGFNAKDCLVIEDSFSGICAAKSAGMKVVGFMGGRHFGSAGNSMTPANHAVQNRLFAATADTYVFSTNELRQYLENTFL